MTSIRRKAFSELEFTDDYMFCKVLTEYPELCRELTELILGRKIKCFAKDPETQKPLDLSYDAKGVRFDVYFEDGGGTVYDIEMQAFKTEAIPKRSRYYHAMIALDNLASGAGYDKLNDTYVIFICDFSMFGDGRAKHTFESRCVEDPGLPLGDGARTVFLSADNSDGSASEELRSFLQFVATGRAEDAFSRRLMSAVERTKQNRRWEVEYMTLQEKLYIEREEGRAEGREEGRAEGLLQGKLETLRSALLAGVSVSVVAEIGGMTEEEARALIADRKEECPKA